MALLHALVEKMKVAVSTHMDPDRIFGNCGQRTIVVLNYFESGFECVVKTTKALNVVLERPLDCLVESSMLATFGCDLMCLAHVS